MNNNKQSAHAKETDGLLNAKEAAARLGLSFWTLYAWARSGRISCVRLGKRLLFDSSDLEKFIDCHKTTPEKENGYGN